MQNASAYNASYFAVGTPGGSAALCARLRLFPLKPLWTRFLRKIHHYTQGSALLSNRDKSLLSHYARWTRAPFTIHPAAVFVSVVTDRALTPRFAGLRQYASLQSSSFHSHWDKSRCWLFTIGLDAQPPKAGGQGSLSLPSTAAGRTERGCLGAPLRFHILHPSVGARLTSFWLHPSLAGASLNASSRLRLDALPRTASTNAPWAALVVCLSQGERLRHIPVAGATFEPADLLNAIVSWFDYRNLNGCCCVMPAIWSRQHSKYHLLSQMN